MVNIPHPAVIVDPVNDVPIAYSGSAITSEDQSITIALYADDIDGDYLIFNLINDAAKGRAPRTYMERVDVYKEDLEGNRSFKTFDLDSILSDNVQYNLEDGDAVTIYSIESVFGEDQITITGFVDEPKTISYRENLSILDIIFSSVEFEEAEFRSQILDSRIDVRSYNDESGLYQTRTYNLDQILNEEYKINDD